MDQRRVFSFLLISFAIVLFFQALMRPPVPPNQPPGGKQAGQAGEKEAGEKQAGEKQAGQAEQPDGVAAPVAQVDPARPQGQFPAMAELDAKGEYITLGSLDPASGYRMLVTLSSTGGSVRRVEMSSPRYTDQHDRAGYWGELELATVEGGGRVQVVGPGTPAAAANIEVGDIIRRVIFRADDPAAAAADLETALSHLKPGEQIEVEVQRGEQPPELRKVTLIPKPFAVLRPEIENYRLRGDKPPADFVERPSLLVTLAALGGKTLAGAEIERLRGLIDEGKQITPAEQELVDFSKRLADLLEKGQWQARRVNGSTVEFTRPLEELGLVLVKRYTLDAVPAESRDDVDFAGYDLRFDVEIRNAGAEPQSVGYRLDGPTGMPAEGWWYAHKVSQFWFSAAGPRDVSMRFVEGPAMQYDGSRIVQDKVPVNQGKPLLYAGVDGQYFSAMLIPQGTAPDNDWFQTVAAIVADSKPDKKKPPLYPNVTCRLVSQSIVLPPGGSRRESFRVFLGPKRPDLLANYHPPSEPKSSLVGLIYYGWFGGVARVMLAILHFFYGIFGNYGIAIIMLTLLVRACLFPLSYKQTQSMAKMQALKPEMDRITEKYKNDMQKKSQATQELYRKHGINPLAGCLPMFLQLPVLMGLYRALMIDVELRNSPLLGHAIRWCSNLSAPDMLFDWSGFMPDFVNNGTGFFGLGPYFNILPVITVGLFLVTQKMAMPPPTNEQAVMQQKMMKYMTVFMGIFFYKVASGLCIYFITSSLWGIGERQLLNKAKNASGGAADTQVAATPRTPPKPDRNGTPAGGKKKGKARRK